MTQFNNPFTILEPKASEYKTDPAHRFSNLNEKIRAIINSSDIVLFMKGNASAPQCGFSANTVQILNSFQKPYKTFDILTDPEVRQGIKEFSNWPTFPQLYIKGKLVGGNDIITEMYENGDLQQVFEGL